MPIYKEELGFRRFGPSGAVAFLPYSTIIGPGIDNLRVAEGRKEEEAT